MPYIHTYGVHSTYILCTVVPSKTNQSEARELFEISPCCACRGIPAIQLMADVSVTIEKIRSLYSTTYSTTYSIHRFFPPSFARFSSSTHMLLHPELPAKPQVERERRFSQPPLFPGCRA